MTGTSKDAARFHYKKMISKTKAAKHIIQTCKKYRPSVHKAALSLVTTAVPALPVNPDI